MDYVCAYRCVYACVCVYKYYYVYMYSVTQLKKIVFMFQLQSASWLN